MAKRRALAPPKQEKREPIAWTRKRRWRFAWRALAPPKTFHRSNSKEEVTRPHRLNSKEEVEEPGMKIRRALAPPLSAGTARR